LTLQEIINARIQQYHEKLNGNKTENENDNKNGIEEKILLQKQSQNEKSNTAYQTGFLDKLPKNLRVGVDIEEEENDNDNDNDGEWD